MSQLQKELVAHARPALEEMATNLRTDFMKRFGEQVKSSHRDKLEERLKTALDAEAKALIATDRDEAEQWAEVAADSIRSIETLMLGATVIADAKAASLIMEAASVVVDTFKGVVAGLFKTIISGVVSGAINAFTGGGAAAAGEVVGGIASAAGKFLES